MTKSGSVWHIRVSPVVIGPGPGALDLAFAACFSLGKELDNEQLFWPTDAQMARLQRFCPKSQGKPRVDGRRVLSGIIFISRNGLRWRDAPREYGPAKTLDNRRKRWGDKPDWRRYRRRNRIEIMLGRLKDRRRFTTR
jgi:transposase